MRKENVIFAEMVEILLGDEDGFHYPEEEMGEFQSRFGIK